MPRDFRYRARPRSVSPMRMPLRRSAMLSLPGRRMRLRRSRTLIAAGAAVAVVLLVVLIVSLTRNRAGSNPTVATVSAQPTIAALATSAPQNNQGIAWNPAATLPPRAAALEQPSVTAPAVSFRCLSNGTRDLTSKERQINQPSYYDGVLFFSAGSGSLDSGAVLKTLYTYDVNTSQLTKISSTNITQGEFYETMINKDWLVWLQTDHHEKNQIYVMNRADGKISMLKNCKNGKPKLRLWGNTLIWMEQVDKDKDELMMVDLTTQENISLYSFADIATYGVSAPCIYDDTIVWSSPSAAGAGISDINILKLNEDTVEANDQLNVQKYTPGTYVHEPVYNGRYYAWIDGNKSPNAKLYLSDGIQPPKVVAEGVTTYSLGDGILVYGHSRQVWVYVLDTGEVCQLTSSGDLGMLPEAYGRTVVWYDTTAGTGNDVLRYKILSDAELGVTATATPQPSETPTPTPTAAAETTADPGTTAAPDAGATADTSATADPNAGEGGE